MWTTTTSKPIVAGTPVITNERTKRVVSYMPPARGRKPQVGRDDPLKHNAKGWVETMAAHYAEVCPPHLWRIHGELYDLSGYLDDHPGGREFLEQTRGSDCTESFEAHHIQGVNKVIMRKYRVDTPPPTDKQITPRYDYEKHFRPIKAFVAKLLAEKLNSQMGSTTDRAGFLYMAVVLQFILVARMAARRQSYVLAMLAGVLLTGCWGVGHNQVHRGRKMKWNWLRYAMDLTGFSSHETLVTHAISHHQNPNLYYDIEVFNFQEVGLFFLTNEERNSWWPYRYGMFHLATAMTAPFLYIGRMIQRLVEADLLNADVIIPNALIAYMGYHSGSLRKGVKLTFTMWAAFTSYFVPMSFCLHHAMDEESGAPLCYHDGEPDFQRDFAAHEIISTLDFHPDMNDYLALTLFSHLNLHTVHHLFPTIDRTYHAEILKALLEENPGGFRDLYYLRPKKVDRNFLDLLPTVAQFMRERRFILE